MAIGEPQIAKRQHMYGLHIPMPSVFVRMNYIKTVTCLPPCVQGKSNLVQPPWTTTKKRNLMENNLWVFGANVLRKYMDLMMRRQMLHQTCAIAFCPTRWCWKNTGQHGNTQTQFLRRVTSCHALRYRSSYEDKILSKNWGNAVDRTTGMRRNSKALSSAWTFPRAVVVAAIYPEALTISMCSCA